MRPGVNCMPSEREGSRHIEVSLRIAGAARSFYSLFVLALQLFEEAVAAVPIMSTISLRVRCDYFCAASKLGASE